MKLSLGPVLFYWSREKLGNFYAEMVEQPLDIIYLGETVCSKRRAMSLDHWLGLARELRECCRAELVLSGLALVEAASELSSLKRLCENGELLVEANDMGAVQLLHERRTPFVAGPALNLYNAHALSELLDCGMRRWVPPVECSGRLLRDCLGQLELLGRQRPEVELFAYGHLPLAYSARCFTARAENKPKDDCRFCCQNYPEGIALYSQERQPLFTLNGIQTMSAEVCNLLPDYPEVASAGVDVLRISPRAEGTAEVVRQFAQVRGGALPPLAMAGCNGYWHGRPGMLRVDEVTL
jgi:O2-independent ubiquinone biosynthesis protein UbiV